MQSRDRNDITKFQFASRREREREREGWWERESPREKGIEIRYCNTLGPLILDLAQCTVPFLEDRK